MITAEKARELLDYDPETGVLTRKVRTSKSVHFGDVAGSYYSNGYRRVSLGNREYLAHRIIWLMAHGEWPQGEVDHINGIRDDNRLSNLRIGSSGENKQNSAIRSDNKTGFVGVSINKAGKFRADIHKNRKQIYLGAFDTPEQAAQAYADAKARLHTFQPTLRAG